MKKDIYEKIIKKKDFSELLKIDVEGVEREVLLGAENVINSGKEVYVMLEDFINPEIISFMEQNGWSFLTKVTSYNSWWRKYYK